MTIFSPQIIGSLWCASELGVSLVKRAKGNAQLRDRHSLGLILLVYTLAFTLGTLAAYHLPSCRLPWSEILRDFGAFLFVAGIALRWYAIIHLGRFFTVNVAIAPDHRVIVSGPDRYIRHPSYTGAMLAVVGFSLTLHNWASLLLIVLPCFAVQIWRIHIEEAALLDALGDAYRTYMQRTKRLIPLVY
jgi:protein-S-isoprenylcysteine O-methyltransferase